MIWREVSGGARSVHIYNQEHAIRTVGFDGHQDLIKSGTSPLRPRLNHFLCLATRSDQDYYNESRRYDDELTLANGLPRYNKPSQEIGCNHKECYESSRKTCITLSALQTCRQMYLESTDVLTHRFYSVISKRKVLLALWFRLTPLQRHTLRKTHASCPEMFDGEMWCFSPKEKNPHLPGLRSLHMNVNLDFNNHIIYEWFRDILEDSNSDSLKGGPLRFEELSPTTATVVVSDHTDGFKYRAKFPHPARYEEIQTEGRWIVQEKRVLAERLGHRLLSSTGMEKHLFDRGVESDGPEA